MSKRIISYLVILTAGLLTACIVQRPHYYYQQSPPEVSLFKEKNEARLSGQIVQSRTMGGGGFQAAYSVTDKLMVGAAWNSFKNSREDMVNGINTGSWSGNYFEGAVGYYKDFGEIGIFETYVGLGNGYQNHKYTFVQEEFGVVLVFPYVNYTVTPIGNAVLNYNKYFLQPSYGISFDALDVALYVRMSGLDFYNVRNNVSEGYEDQTNVESIKNNRFSFMFEPGLTFRAGYQFAKFQMQTGFTGTTGNFRYDSYFITAGIQLAFSRRYLKTKASKKPKEEENLKYSPME